MAAASVVPARQERQLILLDSVLKLGANDSMSDALL